MRDFTKGKVTKSIFLFSIPLILGNLFQQLYTLINSAFVGTFLNTDALAAVGACYPIIFFITSMVLGIASGASVVVSHYYGAKDYDSIRNIISTFYIFFILLGVVVCGLSIIFASEIFSLFSMTDIVKNMAAEYFQIYMIGMFFSILSHSAISLLRGLGDSTTQLYFLIPANILCAILSYVFLGVLNLTIGYSALASLIAQFLCFVSIFIYLNKTHKYIKLSFYHLTFNKSYLQSILSVGVPTGLQQSVISLTQILILSLVVRFGTDATAAYSSAMRVESIALLFVLNISNAVTAFVGTNKGANMNDRVKQGLYASIKLMSIFSLITMVVFIGLKRYLMLLFTNDEQVIRIGEEYLIIYGLFYFFFALQMMFTAFFRGLAKASITMVISVFSLLIVRYPLSYLLSLHYDTIGIWLGAPISWILSLIIYIILFKMNKWQTRSIVKTFLLLLPIFLLFSCSSKAQVDALSIQQNDFVVNSKEPTDDTKVAEYKSPYPQNDFISPLKIPITLAGTFAEIRGTHFHSGIDIRTQERTGLAVIAPMDGYVSRIKIQVYGGGKNLYIVHPNGYTTVYMHLEKYAGKIQDFVLSHQYKEHCYAFDYTFSKPTIYVKQGDTIAFTGESGMAQGPHLHFEIRDNKTEHPINPLLFGLKVEDEQKPYASSFAITPLQNSFVDNSSESKIFSFSGKYALNQGDTINCSGLVYFSILAYDPSYLSSMHNGVWKTELYIDSLLFFSHHIERFSFSNYGDVNATINYPLYIKTGNRYLSSRLMDNGVLPFNTNSTNGVLNVKTDSVYRISWVLTDLKGNNSIYTFFLQGVESTQDTINKASKNASNFISCKYSKQTNYTFADGSIINIPKGALYEDISLNYSFAKGKYSNIYTLHTPYEPLKSSIYIKIKPYKFDKSLQNKYLITRVYGKSKKSEGGTYKNGYVVAALDEFGKYTIDVDTIAPTIKPLNFRSNKRLNRNQQTLKLRISDNLSGISVYHCYLNEQWVLFEYDGKHSMLTYIIDDKLKTGKNSLKIVATDRKGNKKTANYTIVR